MWNVENVFQAWKCPAAGQYGPGSIEGPKDGSEWS